MLVKYNGEYAREQRSYGCSKCGTGRSISGVETYRTVYRTYYSGRLYIFEQGKTYPVEAPKPTEEQPTEPGAGEGYPPSDNLD